MMIVKVFAVVVFSKIFLAASAQLAYKTLTGPLPDPNHQRDHMTTPDTSITSTGCVVEERNGDKKNTASNGVWEGEVSVDSWPFTITICTQLPDMIKVTFTFEQSSLITPCYDETTDVTINSGMPYPCRNFVFCNGTKLGTLAVNVSCDPNACPENNFEVLTEASFPNTTMKLISNVVTTNPIIGRPVTIVAKLQDTSGANLKPPKIISAAMRVLQGDGSVITEVMDVLLDNTVIGKYLPTLSDKQKSQLVESINRPIELIIKYITAFGDKPLEQFRTVTHVIYSALESLLQRSKPSIAGPYSHPVTNSEMVKFTIPVQLLKSRWANNYRYYTQVWATDVNGTERPVCWISGLTDIQLDNSTEDDKYFNGHFDIEMDTSWMIATETLFPVHFRNFSIEETGGFVELVQNDKMEIDHDPWLLLWSTDKRPEDVKITREMMEGYNPYNSEQAPANSKLLLVHGYCSGGEAFPTDQFTDYAVFKDFQQSRSVDEFAQIIDQYARSHDIDAYSIVAHSQGGMAALHLFTYYHSGLDLTTSGGRKIQTVGTPWQGTPIMGGIADITRFFGLGCGYNADLTPREASRWLDKIPTEKQSEVYYYTTAGGERPCQLVTQIVLDNPNDGVAEEKRSQLPGGTWVSHTLRECHSNRPWMAYPSQCDNATRNSEMNKLAAR